MFLLQNTCWDVYLVDESCCGCHANLAHVQGNGCMNTCMGFEPYQNLGKEI
jgi:hypothetical protein